MTPRAASSLTPLLLLLVAVAGPAFAGAPADSLYELPRHDTLFSSKDAAMAFSAGLGVVLVSELDRNISREAPESNSAFARNAARGAEKFGNPAYIAPALAVVWLAGKASGHDGLSGSALRIAGGIAASAAVSSGLKLVAGRARPYEMPNDPDEFRAFSGHTSFPSGHTTVAFALASGIDHETDARWVPYVAYPVAGLVGWSRLRDNRHWVSDVAAGALIGLWTTSKFQGRFGSNLSIDVAPQGPAATFRF